MFTTKLIRVADIKKGDILYAHGARFEALDDAKESNGHRPQAGHLVTAHGPSDCAWCEAKWIDGCEVPGYFSKRQNWTFQGSAQVNVRLVTKDNIQ